MKVKGYVLAALVTLMAGSCDKTPDGVIPEGEMAELMADMSMAEAYRQAGTPGAIPDSVKRNIGEAVLARKGYTYAELDSSLAWYGRNIDKYYELYDKADKILAQRRKRSDKESGGSESDDISNLWPYSDYLYFSDRGLSDGLTFSLPASGIVKGESLEWYARFNSAVEGKLMLGAEYSDGSMTISKQQLSGTRQIQLDLFTDTAKTVKRVFGTVRLSNHSIPAWADSISLRKQPFDSAAYFRINSQVNIR